MRRKQLDEVVFSPFRFNVCQPQSSSLGTSACPLSISFLTRKKKLVTTRGQLNIYNISKNGSFFRSLSTLFLTAYTRFQPVYKNPLLSCLLFLATGFFAVVISIVLLFSLSSIYLFVSQLYQVRCFCLCTFFL